MVGTIPQWLLEDGVWIGWSKVFVCVCNRWPYANNHMDAVDHQFFLLGGGCVFQIAGLSLNA